MTNSDVLKQFSDATGITDPVVEQIVRNQESWVYKNFDRDTHTYAAIDEGNGDAFNSVTWGTWPSWEEDKKQTAKDYKKYVEGDWKPHKAQEESTKSIWDRIDKMTNDLHSKFHDEFNKFTWPNGRGAAFGDHFEWTHFDEYEEYYDAEWRPAEKPLMLEAHKEEEYR